MQRVQTGIKGLDGLIEGGFPSPSTILVTGPPGSGKTIFGLQFLYNGVTQYNEPGFMVNITGHNTTIQWYAERFNWNIPELFEKQKLVFSSYDPVDFEKFEFRTLHSEIIVQLGKVIDQIGAKRVMIDSITPLGQSINDQAKFRALIYYLSKALKEKGVTSVFIGESASDKATQFDVEPYVLDGMIELDLSRMGDELKQTLMVKKMLATKFSISKYLLKIADDTGMELASTPAKNPVYG